MLTKEEKDFLIYWEKNREREKKVSRQLLTGLPLGLLLAVAIVACLSLGWYERADMVARSSLNPIVLLMGLIALIAFVAIFYKKYQWEMKEQHYLEILAKKRKDLKNNDLEDAAISP